MDLVYGTAWKEERTGSLVRLALDAGFRAIDTANQRKHYFEAAVGEALTRWFADTGTTRAAVWLQTKFTYAAGQDHRLPYDPGAPLAEQVRQSVRSSLDHLGTDWLDSLLLHGPSRRFGIGPEDWEVWRTFEALHDDGVVREIGISNCNAGQLLELCGAARVAPTQVQNRCYARLGWDREVRRICRERGIRYQGFSLLTANPEVLRDPLVRRIGVDLDASAAQVVFAFAVKVGMTPLTGTSSALHLRQDLDAMALDLSDEQVARIESLAG